MQNERSKKCLVCGKKGTHYFGIIKTPVGPGTWVDIGLTMLADGEYYAVSKWTGQWEETDYYECDECSES